MAKTTQIYKPKGYTIGAARIEAADGTTAKLVASPSVDDSVCKGIVITSTDTAAQEVQIILKSGANEYLLNTVAVPANAGNIATVPAVDGLGFPGLPLDAVDKKVLPLQGGVEIYAKSTTAVTAAKKITVTAILENF